MASTASASPESTMPPLKEIPPLLRRRASLMGRAALQVLSRPEIPYAGQNVVFASRFGEFSRSLALLRELAETGQVSPQHFSMSVHNASSGLFMMARQGKAPLTALAAGEETALAGLQEARIQIAEHGAPVWLVFADENLPQDYLSLATEPENPGVTWFACLFELAPGDTFELFAETVTTAMPPANPTSMPSASPLALLHFFLSQNTARLRLSPRGGWTLARRGVN